MAFLSRPPRRWRLKAPSLSWGIVRIYLENMIDPLAALSLYRQLEGLEATLNKVEGSVAPQFLAAYVNQESFNQISLRKILEARIAVEVEFLKQRYQTAFQ